MKPPVFRPDPESMPEQLRALNQWVRYRLDEWDATRQKWAKKLPIHPHEKTPAATDDPKTWGTFDDALAGVGKDGTHGVGFVFTTEDPYFGLDGDHTRDPETGFLDPVAAIVLEEFATFAEVSSSGTGFKLIGEGHLPAGSRHKVNGWEVYDTGRFFALTGRLVPGIPSDVRPCQPVLDAFAARYLTGSEKGQEGAGGAEAPEWTVPLAERKVRAEAYLKALPGAVSGKAGHTSTFLAAQAAVRGFVLSDADALAVLKKVFNPRCDPPWSERELKHKIVSARTKGTKEWGHLVGGTKVEATPAEGSKPVIIRLADALAEDRPEPEWAIPGLLPKAGLAGFSGHGGVGKTTLLRQLAFEVAKGLPVLDTFEARPAVPVLVLTVEGSLDFNLDRFRTYLRHASFNSEGVDLFLNWDGYKPDMSGLLAHVEATKAQLVILDTGRRFTTELDENSSKEVLEKLIRPLDTVRRETGASLIFTQHLRKPAPGTPADRHAIRGSTAFTDDVDASLVLTCPEKGSRTRLLQFEKLRFGPDRPNLSLVYDDEKAVFRAESLAELKQREDRRFDVKAGDLLEALTEEWTKVEELARSATVNRDVAKKVLARLAAEGGTVERRTVQSTAGRTRDEYRKRQA